MCLIFTCLKYKYTIDSLKIVDVYLNIPGINQRETNLLSERPRSVSKKTKTIVASCQGLNENNPKTENPERPHCVN